jgi:glucan biosynthesis protein C
LRVLATLLLIAFHSGRAFEPWHIENLERIRAVGWMLDFISHWHMPLFFLLAGASAWYAFGSRTRRAFIGERARRLLVPLAFGMLVIVPPQVHIERIATWCPFRQSPTDFSDSFWAWYPHTFQCCYEDGNLSWHHLWFLMYLFVYSAALAPLFWWLRRGGGRAALDRVTGFLARG